MEELMYPVGPAPRLKEDKAEGEMLPVVEESGLVTAQASREYCHGGSHTLHPVIHLHLIDHDGRIYLQKRAMNKKLLPGYWDTAVGGHVSYGESIVEALFREAGEELGLSDFNPVELDRYVWESDSESELVSVFGAIGNFDIRPDGEEVSEGRFWSSEELEQQCSSDMLTPNFKSEWKRIRSRLEALL